MTDHGRRIDAALAAGDIAGAALLAEAALASGVREPRLYNLAAWKREEAGDLAGAHALLEQALAFDPRDPLIMSSIGRTLRLEGRLRESVAMLDRAIAVDPNCAVAWLERGYTLEAGASLRNAGESYSRATELDPALGPAWAGAASMAGRQGDREGARALAERALRVEPGNAKAICALARVEIDAGEAERAAHRLRALGDHAPIEDRIVALGLLGDALDRLDDTPGAFAAYAEGKGLFAKLYGPRRTGPSYREWVESVLAAFEAAEPACWPALPVTADAGEARTHAFLLGFPRSGTTLVENILASMAEVIAIEERPTLAEPTRDLLGDMTKLADLDAQEAAEWRRSYWDKVAGLRLAPAGKTFVDMDPFKGPLLPLIGRIFPEARVIVMRRDPRDVVWSCLRTAFAPTAASLEFTDIERAARLYDAVMRLTERALETVPIRAFDLRYDRLVADFDTTTKELCAFLDLPWSPELRAFDKTARQRGVTTASSGQVVKGLYDGGNQWRRYETQLAPVLPILQPWIDKLG